MLDERGLTDVEIEVDGGVNPETAKICRELEQPCLSQAMPFILLPTLLQ